MDLSMMSLLKRKMERKGLKERIQKIHTDDTFTLTSPLKTMPMNKLNTPFYFLAIVAY